MAERFRNFIGGNWVEAKSGKWFSDLDPANREHMLGEFPLSEASDVEDAVRAAKAAWSSWRDVPAPRRGELMYKAAQAFQDRKEELSRVMTQEMGKTLREARGDVQEAIDTAFYAAGEGRRLLGITTPSELPSKFAMAMRVPVGVVGVITPWNFPIAIPSWKIFPALMAGNTVVFKPASDTPLCGTRLVEILDSSGFPKGVINLVHGSGSDVGIPLVKHKDVVVISFTGSTEVGREIGGIAGGMLKKCCLELGGKNAEIVMDDADLDQAVEAAAWGAFATAGQRCTATSRLIVHRAVKEAFLRKLLDRVARMKIGSGLDESVEISPLVNEARLKAVEEYVTIGQREGAKLLAGGKPYAKGECAKGFFYEPTVFDNVTPSMRIAGEEIFGPVVSILAASDFDNAIEILNDCSYGLSSSIYTRDVHNAFRAIDRIEAGIVYVNSSTIGAESHLPFGGVKDTGNGHREGGTTVFDNFTEWKTVYVDYSGRLQKAQIDTHG